MEQRKISEESKIFWQEAGYVSMVQIYPTHSGDARIIRGISTEHTLITADIRAKPCRGVVEGVREYGFLPSLESNVGTLQPLILKDKSI